MRVTRQAALSSNCGATMLEFALMLVVFMGLTAGVFDLGIVMRNYSLLTTTTTEAVRKIAQNPCPSSTRTDRAAAFAAGYLQNKLGKRGSFSFEIPNGGRGRGARAEHADLKFPDSNNQNITLEGRWAVSCILCALLPKQIVLSTQSNARLEGGYSCS